MSWTKLAVLSLTLAGAFSIGAAAQTTEEGTGPSEQPSAPMEMGQPQDQAQNQGQDHGMGGPQMGDDQSAQPTEAQPGGPEGEEPAKTDQGVARVSMIHGNVSTQRGDSGDWSAATLNQPVMGGDKVSTGDNARTEVQLDFANVLRLGANSRANIANFTHKNIQIQLGQGIANYSVSKDSEAEPEIDTPNVSLHPAHHDGVFRIEVRPDGDTIIIVRQGEAQIATPQGSTEIHTGDMATIRGDADSAQYKISQAPDRDDWDRWNADRDHMIRNAQSWKHTNRYYTGAQDLDAYGQWQNVPDYGDVWIPNEDADWVPYRNGNWTYEPYYGWTWVGYEPWGWAPYHYGRWFWYGSRWAWWPGPSYGWYRPFWAPAYVSFYGWGGGFGFGFGWGGWGGFGWLPIGPCDWFHPWWGGYRGRFGYVGYRGGFNRWGGFRPLHGGNRFSNIGNIRNAHISRALSTVNAGHFGTGRVTAMPASHLQLSHARMMAGNLPVVPSRASLSASGRAAAPGTVRGGSERFFGTHSNIARPTFQHETQSLRSTMQQSHVGGFTAGGRTATSTRAGGFNNTMQRPSAGMPRTGEMNNRGANNGPGSGLGNRGNNGSFGSSTRENGSQGGFRTFTPPNAGNARSGAVDSPRSNMGPTSGPRGSEPQRGGIQSNRTQSSPGSSRDGFRPFTPPTQSRASGGSFESRGFEGRAPESRGSQGSYWNRTAPSTSMGSRGEGNSGSQMHMNGPVYGGDRGSSRPQLDMRQPIVRGNEGGYSRGNGGYRAPSYGNAPRSMPSYGGPRGTPSYGGGRPSAPSGGGRVSAPSGGSHFGGGGGGGHVSSGGGGGHSGGGGGHSGGGHH